METKIPTQSASKNFNNLDEKSEAIITAAQKTFLENGFDATSMDEIAATAGVSKRTVYSRFKSKKDLFSAALFSVVREVSHQDLDGAFKTKTARTFLEDILTYHLSWYLSAENLAIRRLVAYEAWRHPELGHLYREHVYFNSIALVMPYLKAMNDRGELSISDPQLACYRLSGLLTVPVYADAVLGLLPTDVDSAIKKQVAEALDAFFIIYAVRS